MADLTIKPQAGTGNKLIIQDQAGTARVTTSDAGIDIPAVTGNFAAAGNVTSTGNLTVSGDFVPSAPLSNRNIIINGAMQVAQRGNGPATATGGAGYYQTADLMNDFDNCVAANVTRETTNGVLGTETGNTFNDVFPYSWKWASNGTVSSIPASDRVIFRYRIEGHNVQHLAKGSSVAKPITLSFWVKSSLTGNLQVNVCDRTNTRHIGATYTISAANTWEKKVITFAGDTTGALTNDNGNQLELEWWLTSGTTYSGGVVPTTWRTNAANERDHGGTIDYVGGSGRTWQITGIQLELGSNVTPFEHRSYADEELRCMRYFLDCSDQGAMGRAYMTHGNSHNGSSFNSGEGMFTYTYPVPLRTGDITFTAIGTWNGSGASQGNTNFGPFTNQTNKHSCYVKKHTNSVGGNQNTLKVGFQISAEL